MRFLAVAEDGAPNRRAAPHGVQNGDVLVGRGAGGDRLARGLVRGLLLRLPAAEEVDGARDDHDALARLVVVGAPLALVEPPGDGDLATLAEVLRAGLGEAVPDLDGEEVRALRGAVRAGHREAERRDLAVLGLADRLGIGGEAADLLGVVHEGLLERAGWLSSHGTADDRCAEPSPQGEGSRRQAAEASAGVGDRPGGHADSSSRRPRACAHRDRVMPLSRAAPPAPPAESQRGVVRAKRDFT
jgi:hypothetical protein